MPVAFTYRYMILWDHNPVYVHLYGFDENGNFGEVYQYENNAFYMNQLPDGKKFAGCTTRSVSTSMRKFSGVDAYESQKRTMEESLEGDMEYMLNELGIAMPENSSGNTFSAYDYEGKCITAMRFHYPDNAYNIKTEIKQQQKHLSNKEISEIVEKYSSGILHMN